MHEFVYEPDYKIGHYIGMGAFLLWGVASVWISYEAAVDPIPGTTGAPLLQIIIWLVVGAFCLGYPARQVRRIVFGRRIVVKRYLWPSDSFDYAEVYHVSQKGIELESGNIRVRNVKEESLEELHELMEDLVDRGRLEEEQLKDETMLPKAIMKSVAVWVSVGIGILIAAVVWGAEFAEPAKEYVRSFYGIGGNIRPLILVAAIGAVIFYFPLARMAESVAE